MNRIRKTILALCGGWMLAASAQAGGWEYGFSPEQKMHVAYGPASTGAVGVTEIVNHSCHEKMGNCFWSISVAIPCKYGDLALAVPVLPRIRVPGEKEDATSFLKCGGPNSGLPGAFVYMIVNTNMVREMAKLNSPVVMRVGRPDGPVSEVTMDFSGSGPAIARAEAGLVRR